MMEVTEFEPFITEDRHQRLHQSSFKSQKKIPRKSKGFCGRHSVSTCSSPLYNEEQKEAAYIGIGKA
jgi:hypothetical protein